MTKPHLDHDRRIRTFDVLKRRICILDLVIFGAYAHHIRQEFEKQGVECAHNRFLVHDCVLLYMIG